MYIIMLHIGFLFNGFFKFLGTEVNHGGGSAASLGTGVNRVSMDFNFKAVRSLLLVKGIGH
ncbi:hypothetical protein AM1BK_39430 [Neobacillus kokaensis]|uniref:Uncharacterized protein n=1 Tax=Neobacillus kokaensis TaxID=2759023 RepID=A0ABQ3N642_9BACI|nr:hypothetical protein AM1BK_39430 [Neobacillus kokaensis]